MADEMRREAIVLLTERGLQEVRFPKFKLVRPLLATLAVLPALTLGVTPYQFVDRKAIEKTIVQDDTPIRIRLLSDIAVPAKAFDINLSIEGFDDELVLRSNGNSVVRHHYINVSAVSGYYEKKSYYNKLKLEAITKFRPALDFLKG